MFADTLAYAKLTAQGKMVLSAKVSLRQLRIKDLPDHNDARNRFEMLIEGGKAFVLIVRSCLRVHMCVSLSA